MEENSFAAEWVAKADRELENIFNEPAIKKDYINR